ncbi:MAG: biotin--[acetyl-CoA-carboxylase] ligase [Alphaproteobacteria bacterium]|nr:biotin--[acetyl-CoA-carboxylase] ligase [Alphaproteobacteria bacterium]MBP7729121.1 biotin--[acetyl-CoA-carboxylase] ligase [Alphaproteobacteria bacterium]
MASFYFFDSLPSTMDEARAKALAGAEEGTVVVAFQQSQGRGRRGRVWESLPGNLCFTYISTIKAPLAEAPQLSFVACVAIGERLRSLLPPTHSLTYKWPNDLLLNGKKVGGILLEALSLPEKRERGYLIGCGINLKTPPQQVRYPATSFQEEGIYLSLKEVLSAIVSSLEHYIDVWRKDGFAPIHALWMKDVANFEKEIVFDLEGKTYEGVFEGIDESGFLLLNTPQGKMKLMAGEILAKEVKASGS